MGTLKPVLSGIRIQYDDTDLGDRTLHRIQQNPNLSTRTITAEKGASNSIVWSVLKGENLYPYSIQKVQQLRMNE